MVWVVKRPTLGVTPPGGVIEIYVAKCLSQLLARSLAHHIVFPSIAGKPPFLRSPNFPSSPRNLYPLYYRL